MEFSHSLEVTEPQSVYSAPRVITGGSQFEQDESLAEGKLPVRTIVNRFNYVNNTYVEADCEKLGQTTSLVPNNRVRTQCRFEPGERIGLPLREWVRIAGFDNFENIDETNKEWCHNAIEHGVQGMPYSRPTEYTVPNKCAPLRIAGVEIIINIRYENRFFHGETDWPYLVAFLDVTHTF